MNKQATYWFETADDDVTMDKTTALNSAERFAMCVKEEMNPESVILFGSYAQGVPTAKSDIDIAVVFNSFDEDFLEISSRLWYLSHKINSAIEPHLLIRKYDSIGFLDVVMRTGKIL